jgi:hypothetical protein
MSTLATNFNLNVVKYLWEILEEFLDESDLKKIIYAPDSNGERILHVASLCNTRDTMEFLWRKICSIITDKNSQNDFLLLRGYNHRTALLNCAKNLNENSFCYFFKLYSKYNPGSEDFKKILLEKDSNNINLISEIFSSRSVRKVQEITREIKNRFKFEEIFEIYMTRGENNQNLLTLSAIKSKDLKFVEFCWKIILKTFDKSTHSLSLRKKFKASENKSKADFDENFYTKLKVSAEVLNMLSEKDNFGNNLIHNATIFSNLETFKFVIERIQQMCCDKNSLKNFLFSQGQNGRNLLLASLENDNEEIFREILDLMIVNLSKNKIRKIIQPVNEILKLEKFKNQKKMLEEILSNM